MALLNRQAVQPAGSTIVWSPASGGGDTFRPSTGRERLWVNNREAAPKTITIAVHHSVTGLASPARQWIVPASSHGVIPLLDIYKDPATGLVSITYSGVTTLDVAVVD